MKKFINGKEAEWIIEGARLKKLREDHHMSRAELELVMNKSDARLARLGNGDGVRDARILQVSMNIPLISFLKQIVLQH